MVHEFGSLNNNNMGDQDLRPKEENHNLVPVLHHVWSKLQ